MQLMKHVFQLSGPSYGIHPNVYAILGDSSLILIDSGTNQTELEVIEQNLSSWGLSHYPVSHLFLTHSHFDHSGNAHVFSKRGAEIIAGPGDAEGIELGDERTISYCYDDLFTPCKVDRKIKGGELVQAAGLEFEALHVPGHSSGSITYKLQVNEKIVLFTGDTLFAGPDGNAKLGVAVAEDYDPELYLKSLKRLSGVQADAMLGGHFQPCLRNAARLLKNGYRAGLFQLRALTVTK
jgi:glyoxylase-like metal-dependent hydrolase (beta-lactamase superfamily II)